MKQLICLALFATLTACSASGDAKDRNTAQIKQNKEVQDTYGAITGTYDGKLTHTNHGDENIQLVIYITSEAVTNPDGTTGSRKVPRAFFKRLSPVVADYSLLAGGYTRENGLLSLVNDGQTKDIKSIDARVQGHHLVGSVQTYSGTLGDLDLTFTSPDTSFKDDYKDRLLHAYEAIQGEYDGQIVSPDKSKPNIPVIISLQAVVSGDTPMVIGYYRRPDVPDGVIDLALTVTYRADQSPAEITMNGKGGGRYELNMDGTLVNDTLRVTVQSLYQGYLGTLVAHKVTTKPNPAN